MIPYFGRYLQEPFREFLNKQKASLHKKASNHSVHQAPASWLSWAFEKFVMAMIAYFVLSIVNSMARDYYKRVVLSQAPVAGDANHRPAGAPAKKPKKKVALD